MGAKRERCEVYMYACIQVEGRQSGERGSLCLPPVSPPHPDRHHPLFNDALLLLTSSIVPPSFPFILFLPPSLSTLNRWMMMMIHPSASRLTYPQLLRQALEKGRVGGTGSHGS